MAFKLQTSSTFLYPVKLQIVDEKGRSKTHEIKILFQRFDRQALDELTSDARAMMMARIEGDEAPSPEAALDQDLDRLETFVKGWEDVEIGGNTEFSRDNLRILINQVPSAARDITDAFMEASFGGQKRKN